MDRRQNGIRSRGNSIQMDFYYQGVRCRETLKIKPTKENLRFAQRKKEAISYEIAIGTFDYLEHFPDSTKALKFVQNLGTVITVEQALKTWLLKAEKRCALSTIREYNSSIFYYLIPVFGEFKLNELKASHVTDWMHSVPNISPKRINNILTPLRQTFKDAYCDEAIESNPMDRVKNLPRQTREPKPFSLKEIELILSKLDGQSKNLVEFAFFTGLRTSELVGLKWEDFDQDRKCIHVRRAVVRNHEKATKTRSGERTIWLHPRALKAINNQKQFTEELSDRIFHDGRTNTPVLDDQKIRKVIWTPALKAAGIEYREPYQTRHTFASMMLSSGKPPIWVSGQLGHSNPSQTFKNYARWIPNETEVSNHG